MTVAGRSDAGTVETLEAWCSAWRAVTAASAARLYGVDVDREAMLEDTCAADVAAVLLEFVARLLDSLGPARAAEVVQWWGVVVASAEEVS